MLGVLGCKQNSRSNPGAKIDVRRVGIALLKVLDNLEGCGFPLISLDLVPKIKFSSPDATLKIIAIRSHPPALVIKEIKVLCIPCVPFTGCYVSNFRVLSFVRSRAIFVKTRIKNGPDDNINKEPCHKHRPPFATIVSCS